MKKKKSTLSPRELNNVKGGNNTNGVWRWDDKTKKWVWVEGHPLT